MEFLCTICKRPINGRRCYKAKFCSPACRQFAYRMRKSPRLSYKIRRRARKAELAAIAAAPTAENVTSRSTRNGKPGSTSPTSPARAKK